jgi:hypothetical protein
MKNHRRFIPRSQSDDFDFPMSQTYREGLSSDGDDFNDTASDYSDPEDNEHDKAEEKVHELIDRIVQAMGNRLDAIEAKIQAIAEENNRRMDRIEDEQAAIKDLYFGANRPAPRDKKTQPVIRGLDVESRG